MHEAERTQNLNTMAVLQCKGGHNTITPETHLTLDSLIIILF